MLSYRNLSIMWVIVLGWAVGALVFAVRSGNEFGVVVDLLCGVFDAFMLGRTFGLYWLYEHQADK